MHRPATDPADPQAATPRLLLNEREAQAALSVGYQTLRRLRTEGQLRAVTIGTRVLYPLAELQAFVTRQLGENQEQK